MSSSTLKTRWLLDENVHAELFRYLNKHAFDVKRVPKASSDAFVAAQSKKEKRILVTNDADFCEYSHDRVFAVVWLRIPQNNPMALIHSFKNLLNPESDFSGQLILLWPHEWKAIPLGQQTDKYI